MQLDDSGVHFNDNIKARFGTGHDLNIYHDGSNSYIEDASAGDLILKTDGAEIKLMHGAEHMIKCVEDAQVNLYYDNAVKLATASGGVTVTGDLTVTDDIILNSDSAAITFGADGDQKLFHLNDTGLILQSTATGDDSFPIFSLQPAQTTINDGDVIGMVSFDAAGDTAGGDANATAAAIRVSAEADFSSSVNKTKMEFQTGASEAATTKMSILNDGRGLSPFTARAWAQWDGTTVQSSHNVSSVANPSTGKYTVNYTNNMNNNDYATSGMTHADRFIAHENAPTTSDIDLVTYNSGGSLEGGNYNNIIIFSTGT